MQNPTKTIVRRRATTRGPRPRHLREVTTLAPGVAVTLTGRGVTYVRDIPGPKGAPVVLLLHGWSATAELNWASSFAQLSEHYRVVALDHRGHGRGIRSPGPFTLEACADDAAALLRHLGVPAATVVGYSMGGPIAQLLWRRHRDLVRALVLCATSDHFVDTPIERLVFKAAPVCGLLSRIFPMYAPIRAAQRIRRRSGHDGAYVALAADALTRHHWPTIAEGAVALGRFDSRSWIGEVDVPTAVVLTKEDHVVPATRQRAMGTSVRDASIYEVSADHDACINGASLFVPRLLEACSDVTRSGNGGAIQERHFTRTSLSASAEPTMGGSTRVQGDNSFTRVRESAPCDGTIAGVNNGRASPRPTHGPISSLAHPAPGEALAAGAPSIRCVGRATHPTLEGAT